MYVSITSPCLRLNLLCLPVRVYSETYMRAGITACLYTFLYEYKIKQAK